MNMDKILVVDDERDLCEILTFNLQANGFEADAAFSAEQALKMMPDSYDLLILDVMMDGMSGFELAKMLKMNESTAHIPIIFLTAKDKEEDLLLGFSVGADDYVAKPFSVKELMARVKAVLSRSKIIRKDDAMVVAHEGLIMNANDKNVTVDGDNVPFTRTEFDLLWILLFNKGKVFSRQELLKEVWPKDVVVTERTIDVNITRLRKKIGKYAACVRTRQGFGYCFAE